MLQPRRILWIALLALSTLPTGCASFMRRGAETSAGSLIFIGEFESGRPRGTEIISIDSTGERAVLVNAFAGAIDLLDLSLPTEPIWQRRFFLGLLEGEEITSVAFHPTRDEFFVAIRAADPLVAGRIEWRSAQNGFLIEQLEAGLEPDCVVVDPSGSFVVCANEAESFSFDPPTRRFYSAPGSVTIVRLSAGEGPSTATHVEVEAVDAIEGFVRADHLRSMEREVDWDGDGVISDNLDFDGNGVIEDVAVLAGTFHGAPIQGLETRGEVFLFPVAHDNAAVIEPECVAFSPDGALAYVTLQEVCGLLVVNVEKGVVVRHFGAGVTEHLADVISDGRIALDGELVAHREPDGLAVTDDGRYFVTADEGDTEDAPEKGEQDLPRSGGRTISIFDARTGAFIGDSQDQIERALAERGLYDDDWSSRRGCEPEMVVTFELDGATAAAVTLEKADAVALLSLADPARPQLLDLIRVGRADGQRRSPEGLDVHRQASSGRTFLFVANEDSGTVSVLEVKGASEAR